ALAGRLHGRDGRPRRDRRGPGRHCRAHPPALDDLRLGRRARRARPLHRPARRRPAADDRSPDRRSRTVSSAPSGLRVEHLDTALGIRTTAPRLSWRLPDGAIGQTGYRITADNGWDSGWVDSDQSVLVPYAGPPLTSSQRVEWRVRVRTDLGESPV